MMSLETTLDAPPDDPGIDPSALPEPVRLALVERAALKCVVAGYRRIALFGAGRHTRRVGLEPWTRKGLEVVAILDENPAQRVLLGRPVLRPSDVDDGIDAVVLSSDGHERELAAAARRAPGLAHTPIVRLYDFPASPPTAAATRPRRVRVGSPQEAERLLAANL
jgi:hypothetical protein